ncbi:amidase [Nitratireductor sp. XY-223]|uniref:amidase n=1 Tax=Nitratireductor sp. XY-223 TaxID=2561926 RepID=UPI0010AADFCD|nr:amidase [Nitratireductor sp. XY-223]
MTPTEAASTAPPADATALAEAVRHGETSALALMQASIARAKSDPFGALRHIDEAMGLEAAEAFDKRLADKDQHALNAPFAGVPFLAKDLGNVARGLPAHAGAPALAARLPLPEADSLVFERFRHCGLLPFGVTTTPEFGLALTSEPPGGPIARNPWNPDYSPGGSSGGAASAVASGIVAIAHATDAAGSIRVPAACCGLVGLKPSRGLVPNAPDFDNHLMGVTGELVLARSVRDIRAALVAVSGHTQGPYGEVTLSGVPVKGMTIGLVDTAPAGLGDEEAEALRTLAPLLEAQGNTIIEIDVAALDRLAAEAAACDRACLSVSQAAWLDALHIPDEEVSPVIAAAAAEGRAMSAARFFANDTQMARIAHGCWRLFDGIDAIVMPMLAGGPPKIGAMPPDRTDLDAAWRQMAEIAPRAPLANVAGIPAISLPRGLSRAGLPLSVQLIGPIGADLLLLDIAQHIEAEAPWTYPAELATA